MIVTSLLLISVAVVLLVLGLAGGSSLMLIISIAASLLAAVALVVGARQAAAGRATGYRDGPAQGMRTASRYAPAEPEIPVQHVPPTVDAGGSGWRQPPEPSATGPEPRVAEPGIGAYDDEPAVRDDSPAEATRVARRRRGHRG